MACILYVEEAMRNEGFPQRLKINFSAEPRQPK